MDTLHILAVDDERDMQVLLEKKYRKRIKAGELVVHYAPGSEAALACLETFPDIAVALCDIKMPGMDGLTLLQHLVKRHPYVGTIMVTAYGDIKNIRAAMNGGAMDFLTKPLNFADLDVTIEKAARQAMRVRLSEHYVQMLVKEAQTAFAVVRDGQMVFVNDAWDTVFDAAATRLIRSHLDTLVPADFVRQDADHVLSDEVSMFRWIAPATPDFQSFHVRGMGGELYVKTCYWLTLWEGEPATMLIVHDVTDETRRQQREARYHDTLRKKVSVMRSSVAASRGFGEFVGSSEAMHHVYELILAAAACAEPVMVLGETGTGKELAARMIHDLSDRSACQLVPVNCGAIADTLFEREMFGHVKGAFTGADRTQPGWFERAHQGTLLLDEVGELTPGQQVKFLRAIDTGEYCPVGGNRQKHADVRIIAATNRSIAELAQNDDRMRKDFFHRLHGLEITLPPLRDRQEDIPLLVAHFLAHAEGDRVPVRLSDAQLDDLMAYDWPGNVRELRQVMQRYAATGHLTLEPDPDDAQVMSFQNRAAAEIHPVCQTLQQAIEAYEKQHILHVLNHHDGRRADTAAALSITERHLYRKIKAYGL